MSRCYPFPPPGYAGKCSSHEALILSIKLQKERERAISDSGAEKLIPEKSKSSEKRKDKEGRKKDKKSKEERKKEKEKEKRKDKQKTSAPVENGKLDNIGKLPKAVNVALEPERKLLGSSAELLERSIVTEEHGRPIDSQNASCSSDSTGNSGKRKKIAASPSGIQSNGNIIRIRLSSSQKRDEPSTSGSKEQEAGPVPYPTSHNHVRPGASFAKPESSVKTKDANTKFLALPPPSASTATLQLVPTVDDVSRLKEKTTVNNFQKEKLTSLDKGKSSQPLEKLSSRDKKMQKKESIYQKLFVDWVAPPLEGTLAVEENGDDDEEWLFGKKGEDRSAKRLKSSEESQSPRDILSCSASVVSQPRAHLLADVGIYALPFTVPF